MARDLFGLDGEVTTRAVVVSDRDAIIAGYRQPIADHGRVDTVFANSGRPSCNMTGSSLTVEPEEWHDLLGTSPHGDVSTPHEGARRWNSAGTASASTAPTRPRPVSS